jgi:hypothetical protein
MGDYGDSNSVTLDRAEEQIAMPSSSWRGYKATQDPAPLIAVKVGPVKVGERLTELV